MILAYPATIRRSHGRFLVRFPDVPEAHTETESRAQAAAAAADCLIAALGGYIELRRQLPKPSASGRGRILIALPPLIAAKLGLYRTLRAANLSNTALAERLGLTENTVRRLLDLDHRSHVGQIEMALNCLSKTLLVDIRDAA
jgi:antitoxin HicB